MINSFSCCDALEGVKQIPRNSVNFACLDIPYVISNNRSNNNKMMIKGDHYRFGKCDLDIAEWDHVEVDFSIFREIYLRLIPGGSLACFYDVWKMQSLRAVLEEANFQQFRLCEWVKNNPVPINSEHNYLSNAKEYFVYCVRKGHKRGATTFNSKYDKGTYHAPLCHPPERVNHPTQKPLKLIKQIIEKHTNVGDVVLDCFAGSGTTAVAAKMLNRNYICFEINPTYCELALSRINEF